MENWLPSSDDESEEMEAMRAKLQSLQEKGRRKRMGSWSNGDNDDDNSSSDDKEASKKTCDATKKVKTTNEKDDDDSCSLDLEAASSLAKRLESSWSPCPSPLPPTTHVDVSAMAEQPTPSSLHASQSTANDDESAATSSSSSSSSQSEFLAAAAQNKTLGGDRTEEQDNLQLDDFDDLHFLDDATLEAALKQAEAEYSKSNSSVASKSAASLGAADRDSPQDDEPSKNHRVDAPDINKDEISTPLQQDSHHESTLLVRQATLHEEDWIEAYLQQEQDTQQESASVSRHVQQEHTTQSNNLPLQEEPSYEPQDSHISDTRATTPEATSVPDSQKPLGDQDDEWVKELLHQQELQAKGQVPIPTFDTSPTMSIHHPDQDHFAQAFDVTSTTPKESSFYSHETFCLEDDEGLDIPTRDNDRPANDGIERDERYPEVDPSRCPRPARGDRPKPLVHHFTSESHPPNVRRRLPVVSIFQKPQIAKFFTQKFESFNTMQSELANMLAHSDDHIVLAAPTGAGKTAIFEMAMARFFAMDMQSIAATHDRQHLKSAPQVVSNRRKIVYISPSKALCEERFEDWTKRLAQTKLGIEVATVTGDGDPGESFRDVASAQIILTTPEKWDSLTRRWTENFFLLASVKLVLIDEVHLLADQSRGPCIESVINRLKSIQHVAEHVAVTQEDIVSSSFVNTSPEAIASPMRIVAVSATLPNISEIAEFLTANEAFVFDASFRPVPLTTHVLGMGNAGEQNSFKFWNGLDRQVPQIIQRFSQGRPTIVFCHSKAETERLADTLAKFPGIGQEGQADTASRTKLLKLQRVLFNGIGFHHAGLEVEDRHLVEQAFAARKVRVLCTTTTLAQGVNTPARLVIVKGTKAWRGGSNGYQDLDQASLLQMLGRAGRPGYDDSGTAVILTETRSKQQFEDMAASGLPPAKSQLPQTFEEILAPELSQRVIRDMNSALDWIKGTLYYVQMKRDPSSYSIRVVSEHSIDTHLLALLRESFRKLQQIGTVGLREGSTLKPYDGCHIMSLHQVDYSTMKMISELPFDVTQKGMLRAICQIERLQRSVRRSEKKTLNATHKQVPHKLEGALSKVRVQQPWEKAFVLLQASIGRLELEDYTLRSESISMCDFASRMLSAAEEFGARATKNGEVVVQSLKLRRSLETSLWSSRDGVLGQFSSLSDNTITSLKFHGVNTFDDVLGASEEALEKAASRTSPFGANLKTAVQRVVSSALKIEAAVVLAKDGTRTPQSIRCSFRAPGASSEHGHPHTSREAPDVTFTAVAYTDRPNGCLFYKRGVTRAEDVEFKVPPKFGEIKIHLIASMVGLDDVMKIKGNAEIYRTLEPVPTKTKGKNKRACSASAFYPVPTVTTQARGKTKSARKNQVTPSPKLPLPKQNTSHPSKQKQNRQRSGNIADFLARKPTAMKKAPGKQVPEPTLQTNSIQTEPHEMVIPTEQFQAKQQQFDPSPMYGHEVAMQEPQPPLAREARPPLVVNNTRLSQSSTRPLVQARQQASVPRMSPFEREHSPQPLTYSAHSQASRPIEPSRGVFSLPGTSAAWKQVRRQIQRSQKRVHSNKKDNVFAGYQHDPNDSEGVLDMLSQRTTPTRDSPTSSVIPPESQRAVDMAYKKASTRIHPASSTGKWQKGLQSTSRQHRRFFPSQVNHEPSLLAQKANEQEMYSFGTSPQSGQFSPAPFAPSTLLQSASPAYQAFAQNQNDGFDGRFFAPIAMQGEGHLQYAQAASPAEESFAPSQQDVFDGQHFAPTSSRFFSRETPSEMKRGPTPSMFNFQEQHDPHYYSRPDQEVYLNDQSSHFASQQGSQHGPYFTSEQGSRQSPYFASQQSTHQSPYISSLPADYQSFSQGYQVEDERSLGPRGHVSSSRRSRAPLAAEMSQFEDAFC